LGLTKAPDRKEALVSHGRARLTPLGRLLLVNRIVEEGWTVAAAAESLGVSRATAYKWVQRFREEGRSGLEDRTSAPHRLPGALPPRRVERILRARRRLKVGPHRLGPELGHPRSTVYAVLRRHGLSRLDHLDRPTAVPVRYERERPGELVHIDVKKLGRVRPGGGWKMLGRTYETRRDRTFGPGGYDFLHVAVDDHSRYAYVEVHPDERGSTCAGFLTRTAQHFAELGIQIERVMTDQAKNYVLSRDFQGALDDLGATHKVTRPYRPQTNGKAERFNRTMLDEWAYVKLYRSNGARLTALPKWIQTYNHRRPHTALGGLPPISRVSTT
jgi:transposase InsO family protein